MVKCPDGHHDFGSAENAFMNANAEQVLAEALKLPDDDRLELVEALVVSFQVEAGWPFDESWRAVIHRRAAELESGQVTSVPWSEVKRQAREALGG
jgi:putative addiction module component (TIGR02574 family)